MIFMKRKALPPPPSVVLPEPKVICQHEQYRVVSRPEILTRWEDGRPRTFRMELIVESFDKDALNQPAWRHVGVETFLIGRHSPGSYIFNDSAPGWRAFFSLVRAMYVCPEL